MACKLLFPTAIESGFESHLLGYGRHLLLHMTPPPPRHGPVQPSGINSTYLSCSYPSLEMPLPESSAQEIPPGPRLLLLFLREEEVSTVALSRVTSTKHLLS